jgi:5-methylcytosine-specific restriction endonuclease McrA
MCRGRNFCTEIDSDPQNWDKRTTLRRPEWMDKQIELFFEAVELFFLNKIDKSKNLILSLRNEEITHWYVEHGQMSGMHRKNILNRPEPVSLNMEGRDIVRSPKKYQKQVFERDGYKCRYCGAEVISQEFLKLFSEALNLPKFRRGNSNLTTHGIYHLTWPVADHVYPWVNGGGTNLSNLVTSCAPCNYGKAGYTIDQIGINDPFNFPIEKTNWDGFDQYVKILKNRL